MQQAWPPADWQALVDRWRDLGEPDIFVDPGTSISDLERWFWPLYPAVGWMSEDRQRDWMLVQVRRFLGGVDA